MTSYDIELDSLIPYYTLREFISQNFRVVNITMIRILIEVSKTNPNSGFAMSGILIEVGKINLYSGIVVLPRMNLYKSER